MSKYVVDSTDLVSVADAIRTKGGTEDALIFPTGFVSAVEAITTGGGGGLNFAVVGGTTEPTNPAENTIWVNTQTEIGTWTISTDEPSERTLGDVWIVYVGVGGLPVDVLEESIVIRLYEVRQYDGTAWIRCETKVYQSDEWKDINGSFWLIKDGKLILKAEVSSKATFVNADGYVDFGGNEGGYHWGWFSDVYIDGNVHSALVVEGEYLTNEGAGEKYYLAVWENSATPYHDNHIATAWLTGTRVALNVSSLNGSYKVGFISTYTRHQKITALYLEE